MCVLISSIRSVAIKRLEQKLITCKIATTRCKHTANAIHSGANRIYWETSSYVIHLFMFNVFSSVFRLYFALHFFFSYISLLLLILYLFNNAIEYDFTTEEEEGAVEQQQETTWIVDCAVDVVFEINSHLHTYITPNTAATTTFSVAFF